MPSPARRSRLKSLGIAGAATVAIVGFTAGVLQAAKSLGGSLEDYVFFIGLAVAVLVISYLIVQRLPVKDESERTDTTVVSERLVIPPGTPRIVRTVRLDEGEVVFGTLAEMNSRVFYLGLRSAKEQRKANKGVASATIGDFTGISTGSFQSQIPAPASGNYHINFEQITDLSGRVIQADLRRRPDRRQ